MNENNTQHQPLCVSIMDNLTREAHLGPAIYPRLEGPSPNRVPSRLCENGCGYSFSALEEHCKCIPAANEQESQRSSAFSFPVNKRTPTPIFP